ncbi:hypothetical protein Poli38472_002068 [Pythium oligandrum]|uniref:Polycomb protein VEFS-Box domain-containing protein n=1 Tax=Pythium oligandrum TaxID=41045 RepID=A0A8K1CGU6_PYTOL|nr:hypothetical protein Poli38472_002068 [Pythium oligandrum]|eukprot:TMW63127.1 hypothetical protein Poli38472_002068 [Pythium oligandrum]
MMRHSFTPLHGAKMTAKENGKRKRDGGDDTCKPKERRLKARQEELEEEFAATYHALTSLYKLLEVQHLHSPLFLPRTLSYRLVLPQERRKKQRALEAKKEDPDVAHAVKSELEVVSRRRVVAEPTGATLREFKIGMTAETIEAFKRENKRVGLLFSVFTADGKRFATNSFDLVATCLTPVPITKEVKLPSAFVHPHADIYMLAVQVVEISDVADKLASDCHYAFDDAPKDVKPVIGAELLRSRVLSRTPLYGNILRLDVTRRRTGYFSLELPALESSSRGVVKLQFRVQWDPLPKTSRMLRLQSVVESNWPAGSINIRDEDIQVVTPKPFKPSPWTRRGNTNVWFHYLYHSLLRRMSEKRPDYSCAWCNQYAGSLRGLVSHLTSSHTRFRFQVVAGHDNIPHIYVWPRQLLRGDGDGAAVSMSPSLCEVNLDDDEQMDKIEQHFTYISGRRSRAKRGNVSEGEAMVDRMQEFDELEESAEEATEQFYAPLLQRQYFHSRTGAVVLDHEKDYDSDDDVDEEWITQQSERLLDEFEDVSLEEKEFMKMWNRHVKENRILADFMVASSCRLFAKRHGERLLKSGLRHNFLLHLFNLWDNSLLNSRAIIDCILIVDHHETLRKLNENGAENGHADHAAASTPSA